MLSLWLVSACASSVVLPTGAHRLPPQVDESSGLVRSRAHPGVWWTHNDSGGKPRLYAVDGEGRLVRAVDVAGARAVDWEDLALDDAGNLWIADSGNNGNDRRDLTAYRVPEPDPWGTGTAAVDRVVRFSYSEQTGFPDRARRDFDGEALIWGDGTLWLYTKQRSTPAATLYRFPSTEGEVALVRVGEVDLSHERGRYAGLATAADLDSSGRHVVLLTYHGLYVLAREDDRPGAGWTQVVHRVALDPGVAGQCEAVAWDGEAVVFTNEDGIMHRVPNLPRATSYP